MSALDFLHFEEALPRLPRLSSHHCPECALTYSTAWFHPSTTRCFFCSRFRTPHITRYALLRETEWFYLQSGQSDPILYYETYIGLLHRWADRHRLPFTPKDKAYQDDLLRSITP